ncbi:nucleotide-diphospho-sugar transferase, partial [Mucor mucedo]|uniref:nucleotide-diphospho-sugar transferase n=1 Tax=Mucor mucedo TaxID=29922 RepID=UPI0022205F36
MMNYTLNWIEALKRTDQNKKFLVFAIDQEVVDVLTHKGYEKNVILVPKEWLKVPLSSDFTLWKNEDHRPITHAKTLIVERLLYMNIIVWFSDVDIVILSPHILDAMLVQITDRPNTHMLFSQEVEHRTVNSGFYLMKPSKITKQFMARIIEEQDEPSNEFTQQKIMNRVLKAMFPRDYVKSPYRLMDLLLYPNGKYFFKMDLPTRLGFNPLMVHANNSTGDIKEASLIKAGLWFL